jgi:DMSO/TMAO reductase YedYZ molybdopterin-dependent catalytic subunit
VEDTNPSGPRLDLPDDDPSLTDEHDEGGGKPFGRRILLSMLGLGAGGILFGGKVSDIVGRALAPITAADRTGLTDLFPAAGRFRIYSVVGSLPQRSAAEYRLQLGGLVDRPLDLSYADLTALPATSLKKDFQCVTGWRVPAVPWKGVLLRDLLEQAGVQAGATALRFHSFDGAYTESLTLEQARRDDVMVAWEMENGPISRAHGGPVRLYVAPMYGYKSIKWLDRIEVGPSVVEGYWERRGYDTDAWIGKSNGRSDAPVQ